MVHVAEEVTLVCDPSLKFAVAVSCCVLPAISAPLVGDTVTDTCVTAVATDTDAVPVCPLSAALMDALPPATAVTIPAELTVAIEALEVVHFAALVTFAVEPSLYFAVAVSCWLAPALSGSVEGLIEIEVRVFCGGGVWVAVDPFPHPETKSTPHTITAIPASTKRICITFLHWEGALARWGTSCQCGRHRISGTTRPFGWY